MRRLLTGAAILAITLVNFFQFPGHTWLQSDTQIYVPILERIWDPAVLDKDLIATHPHVAFTIYDETAIALRKVTGLEFRQVLEGEQFLFRALGIWGVYLMATSLGLSDALALLVAGVFSLGATIMGPAVLVFEYEPVPRGFAAPLLFLAIGLIAHERYLGAGLACSVALLFHPPTVAPVLAAYLCMAIWPAGAALRRQRLSALWPLCLAALLLFAISRLQATAEETRPFFTRLDPHLEQLQQMRASYNWISIWWKQWLAHYLILYALTMTAWWRLRRDMPQGLRSALAGLPSIAVVTVPLSYLLLEKMHWALVPEFQPTRALLFVTALAMILGAAAAVKAIEKKRYPEALAWLVLAYLLPTNRVVTQWPSWNRVEVVILLSLAACGAIWAAQSGKQWPAIAISAAIAAPYFLIPTWGRVENYPRVHNPDLRQLSQWARMVTPKDAVFLFPDADQDLYPGVFRADAIRAVYVDWKLGGQVNFFKDLGEEWWSRWQKTMAAPFDAKQTGKYRGLGIDYMVVLAKDRMAGAPAVFENERFSVYPVAR